jgi:hypothetical protein
MKKYECFKCNKFFAQQKNLNYHLNKAKPCDMLVDIANKSEEKNINMKHINSSLDECKCPYCNKQFSRKNNIMAHIKNNCKSARELKKIAEKKEFDELKQAEEKKKIAEKEENEKSLLKKKLAEFDSEIKLLKKQNKMNDKDIKNDEKITNKFSKLENEIEILKKQNKNLVTLLTKSLKNNEKTENPIEDEKSENNDDKTKPQKKRKIPLAMRIKVWNKHIGEDIGKSKCLCCKERDITQLNFDCGHIIAESKGGKMSINNLLPICRICNSSMSNMNMHDYQKLIAEMQE